MPRIVDEKVGEIRRRRVVKTAWDKFVEFVQGLLGLAFIVFVLVAIFS